MATPTYLSPPALARMLGVAEETVYRWIRSGAIPQPSISLGGIRGYSRDAAETIRLWYDSRRSAKTVRLDV